MNKLKNIFNFILNKIIKKIKLIYIFVVLILVILICGGICLYNYLNEPKNLEDYLKSENYKQDKWECYTKTVKNSVPEEEEVQFCFNECKYFSTFSVEKIAIDFTNLNAVYKYGAFVNLEFNLNDPDGGTCNAMSNQAPPEGTESFNTFCEMAKQRAKQRVETFKNIVQDYSLKCKPKIISDINDFAKSYPKMDS